ncbi:MAG: LysR substrate-binding domain-containing protein [Oscillospiraceae bacterium]
MDLARLADFFAVARNGSIKKAAEEMSVSPATLSARIRSFEKSLGISLFVREGKNLVLTEEGARLASNAPEILDSYNRLTRELRAAQRHYYRSLRIAVTGSGLPLHLGPFLDRLNLTYPAVRLELLDDSRYSISEGLQSGAVDVYFASVTELYQPKNVTKHVIAASNQYVLMPRQNPLANRTAISIRELDGACFIPYPKTAESCIRDFQLSNLNASGIRYTLYEGETSLLFYKLLVPVGKGLILCPTPMMDLPPNTVCVPVSDLPYPATPCFFYDKTRPNSEVDAFVQDFISYLKEAHSREHGAALRIPGVVPDAQLHPGGQDPVYLAAHPDPSHSGDGA